MNERNEHNESTDGAAKPIAGVVLVAILAIAVVAFILQNTKQAPITWLFFDGRAAIWVVIVVSAVLGAVLERMIAYVVHRRRRTRRD